MKAMHTRGLVAATFAPMRPNGDIDVEAVPALVQHLVGDGVAGIFCNGSTGEGESLTPEERRAVAAAFVSAAAGRLRVFVQVGSNSLRVAEQLAAHAADVGADAIAATPPAYFKPASVPHLVACLREIAAAAPNVPFFYYHIPAFTSVRLDMVDLLRQAGEAVPSFAGVKFSEVDPSAFSACTKLDGGRFEILWGSDETLLEGLTAGAKSAIGSTYCFAARAYREMMAAHASADLEAARTWQARAGWMIDIQIRRGGLPALKATMQLIGVDCGPVRLPLRTLSPSAVDELRSQLEEIGFFDWGRG
jgi:N-acetylneuraminate lyase